MSTTNAFNTESQDVNTGKQQQQSGYLEKAYNLLSNAAPTTGTAGNTSNSTPGTTDSTTNYHNQQPHVGGVGDMSTKDDADVARLPEERANPNPFTSGGTSESLENPKISDPNSIQQRLNARDPPNPYPEGNAGVEHPSDQHFRNQQDHVGGVGDLGTMSDADVVRLPEERANPDPLSSTTRNINPFKDTTTGAATGSASTSDDNRDTTDTTSTRPHGWKPEDKSWDTRNVVGTMGDPTQHGHSGGVTGSNIDTDHGLGMPHRQERERGNRDEGAIGEHNLAGATDFQSGHDDGNRADTRDRGLNERTHAPIGGVDTTSSSRREDAERATRQEGAFGEQNLAGATALLGRDAEHKADTRDHGVHERTPAPVGGVDTTSSTHREDMERANRQEGAHDRHNLPGTTDFQSGRDAGHTADTRDHDVHERTHAPVGGVDTTSSPRREDRDDAEGHDEHDTTTPTGKSHPSKLDKIRGKFMVAKGKLAKDEEAIRQGHRLQTEGITVSPDDFVKERRE